MSCMYAHHDITDEVWAIGEDPFAVPRLCVVDDWRQLYQSAPTAVGGSQDIGRAKVGSQAKYIWPWADCLGSRDVAGMPVRIVIMVGSVNDCTEAANLLDGGDNGSCNF